jgi:hypothetical protein
LTVLYNDTKVLLDTKRSLGASGELMYSADGGVTGWFYERECSFGVGVARLRDEWDKHGLSNQVKEFWDGERWVPSSTPALDLLDSFGDCGMTVASQGKTSLLAGTEDCWMPIDRMETGIITPSLAYEFDEPMLIDELRAYVDQTYGQHYVAGRRRQCFSDILDDGNGLAFALGNIKKYITRQGRKAGTPPRKDLMKVLHYALLALFAHDFYEAQAKTEG